jgi:hypothetical protein
MKHSIGRILLRTSLLSAVFCCAAAVAQTPRQIPTCLVSGPATISFGLTAPADGIYTGDEVTFHWDVRYSDGRPWDQEIMFTTDPPLMRGNIGSAAIPERTHQAAGRVTFRARWQSRGTIRLETRCGGSVFAREIIYAPIEHPHLDRLSTGRAGERERVTIQGRSLGSTGTAELVVGDTSMPMRVHSWTNTAIEVSVPDGAPVGHGYIHVFKGRGRLQSNSEGFNVIRVLAIDRRLLQLVHDLLGLSRTQVHLDDGGSFIRFSQELKNKGATDSTFSVPRLEIRPSSLGESVQRVFSPVTVERLRYSVNEINLSGIALSISGGQLVIRISFESNGSEVKGKALTAIGPFGIIETGWDDGLAPDIEANDVAITLTLTPRNNGGALQFTSAAATVDGSFRINNRLVNTLAREFGDFENRIKSAANDALVAAMPGLATALSNTMMTEIRRNPGLGVNRILSIRPSAAGNSLRVEYE